MVERPGADQTIRLQYRTETPYVEIAETSDDLSLSDCVFRPKLITALAKSNVRVILSRPSVDSMTTRTSQYNPGNEIPEKSWVYRFIKRRWFSHFGVYDGYDHSQTAAPALVQLETTFPASSEPVTSSI